VNEFRAALANNLKLARHRLGLTQQDLAEACQLSTNYLATIEIGGKFPSSDTLSKLAAVLKLKPYQLFFEEDDTEAFDRAELIERYNNKAKGFIVKALDKAAQDLKRTK